MLIYDIVLSYLIWRHDTQHDNIQHNDSVPYDNQQNYIHHNNLM